MLVRPSKIFVWEGKSASKERSDSSETLVQPSKIFVWGACNRSPSFKEHRAVYVSSQLLGQFSHMTMIV